MALSNRNPNASSQPSPPLKSMSSTKKRKRTATSTPSKTKTQVIDLTGDDVEIASPSKKKKRKVARLDKSPTKGKTEEKRLKRFRDHAPGSFLEKLHRATTQRMFVIDRSRGGTEDVPEEIIEMAGTTGNIYSVNIGLLPSCTCPDNQKGNQCKHIIFVRSNNLGASPGGGAPGGWPSSFLCHQLTSAQGPTQCLKSPRTSRIPTRLPLL